MHGCNAHFYILPILGLSNAGMLHPLLLKQNFVLEVRKLSLQRESNKNFYGFSIFYLVNCVGYRGFSLSSWSLVLYWLTFPLVGSDIPSAVFVAPLVVGYRFYIDPTTANYGSRCYK
jgi:hypothetical protein